MLSPDDPSASHRHPLTVHIDRHPYTVEQHELTGERLRALVAPPIPADFDLWREETGPVEDQPVGNDTLVVLKENMHFYSAPSTINPGRC
jgi:hypothetical protein